MRVDGKQVVVMGLARSGIAAARFLSGNGARVTVTDQAGEDDLGAFAEEARQLGVALELGGTDGRPSRQRT
jgi:UDP-N-acetylmuramoylalanine--D-glutamate ligase